MVIQGNDLSQLSGHIHHFSQQMTEEEKNKTKECKTRLPDQYIGRAIVILKFQRDNVDLWTQEYEYHVKRESADHHSAMYIDPEYKGMLMTQRYVHQPYDDTIKAALAFTSNPTNATSMSFVRNFTQVSDTTPAPTSTTTTIATTNAATSNITMANVTQENVVNTLAPENTTTAGITYHYMRSASSVVNNTYINVVHDCENVCVRAVFSNETGFMPTGIIKAHVSQCVEELAAISTRGEIDDRSAVSVRDNHDSIAASTAYGVGALAFVAFGACATFVTFAACGRNQIAANIRARLSRIANRITNGMRRIDGDEAVEAQATGQSRAPDIAAVEREAYEAERLLHEECADAKEVRDDKITIVDDNEGNDVQGGSLDKITSASQSFEHSASNLDETDSGLQCEASQVNTQALEELEHTQDDSATPQDTISHSTHSSVILYPPHNDAQ